MSRELEQTTWKHGVYEGSDYWTKNLALSRIGGSQIQIMDVGNEGTGTYYRITFDVFNFATQKHQSTTDAEWRFADTLDDAVQIANSIALVFGYDWSNDAMPEGETK